MRDQVDYFRKSIHGGPQPSADQLAALFAGYSLELPMWVVAVQGLPEKRSKIPGWVLLDWHPGILYCLAPCRLQVARLGKWVLANGGLSGAPQRCTGPSEFIKTVQMAIIALRRAELGVGKQQDQRAIQTLEAEAVRRLCEGGDAWLLSVQAWLDAVFEAYHQLAINIIRRQVVEMVTTCSRRYPLRLRDLNFLVSEIICLCSNVFVLTELKERLLEAFKRLGQCLQSTVLDMEQEQTLSPDMAQVWALMQKHYCGPVKVAQLAAAVGLSEGHVSRQFRAEVGSTIQNSLIALRLSHARDLLLQTRQSVLEIALDSGFPSVEHFQRMFKKVHGLSPHKWRKRVS